MSVLCLPPQGLEEAEQQLQKERTELDGLQISQSRVRSNPMPIDDSDEEEIEEERLFLVQQDCRMMSILQEALYKREEVVTWSAAR